MPAVFPPCCRSSSAKCFLLGHHFLSKTAAYTDIFLNQLIQFYSNNAINLHYLTTHSATVRQYWPTKWRSYYDHRYVTSLHTPYLFSTTLTFAWCMGATGWVSALQPRGCGFKSQSGSSGKLLTPLCRSPCSVIQWLVTFYSWKCNQSGITLAWHFSTTYRLKVYQTDQHPTYAPLGVWLSLPFHTDL